MTHYDSTRDGNFGAGPREGFPKYESVPWMTREDEPRKPTFETVVSDYEAI
jgi:hypothetical protein